MCSICPSLPGSTQLLSLAFYIDRWGRIQCAPNYRAWNSRLIRVMSHITYHGRLCPRVPDPGWTSENTCHAKPGSFELDASGEEIENTQNIPMLGLYSFAAQSALGVPHFKYCCRALRSVRPWAALSCLAYSGTTGSNSLALVTGSSRGLGLEFTRQLLQRPNQRCVPV